MDLPVVLLDKFRVLFDNLNVLIYMMITMKLSKNDKILKKPQTLNLIGHMTVISQRKKLID